MMKRHHLWRSWGGNLDKSTPSWLMATYDWDVTWVLDRPQLKITYDGGSSSPTTQKESD